MSVTWPCWRPRPKFLTRLRPPVMAELPVYFRFGDVSENPLLSSVYSQYWPANISRKTPAQWNIDGRFDSVQCEDLRSVQGCRRSVSADQKRGGYVRSYDGSEREFFSTKKAGYRLQCWTEEKKSEKMNGQSHIFDKALDALTKAEFRSLKEQIKDVSSSISCKYKAPGYQKFLRKDENNPVLYRSQLAESLKTFRLEPPRPRLQPDVRQTEMFRCKPIIGTKPIVERPQTAPALTESYRSSRPQSSRSYRTEDENLIEKPSSQTYDTLNCHHIYDLAAREHIDSGYGDINTHSTTSGDEVSEPDSSDDDQPEPPVDASRKIPEFPALRPDPLESMYMSESERDYQKYDFDASILEIPTYEFKYSGPEEFAKVDFEDLASYGKNWRAMTKRRPKDTELELLIDRLIEMERLVISSEEWEDKRRDRCRNIARQKQEKMNLLRAQGRPNRVSSARSRRCCKNCLQQACTGDCPLKTAFVHQCLHCRQEFCSGRCIHSSYNSHSRQTASESESEDDTSNDKNSAPVRKTRPKSCQTCRRQDTNAKLLNTNQILQGRPRSAMVTFNRASSATPTKEQFLDEKHKPHSDIQLEFARLNIVPHSRPGTANKRPPRARAALMPGKSPVSQRHDSISVPKAERVRSAPPRLRRVKSGKKLRRLRHAATTSTNNNNNEVDGSQL